MSLPSLGSYRNMVKPTNDIVGMACALRSILVNIVVGLSVAVCLSLFSVSVDGRGEDLRTLTAPLPQH